MQKITVSIVTYNPDWPILKKTVASFLALNSSSEVKIWDNSPLNTLEKLLNQTFQIRVVYTHSPHNIGYGAGHNRNFKNCTSDYFCPLNPDIELTPQTLVDLMKYADQRPSIGLISCTILNPDGSPQKVHKYLPSFTHYVSLIFKRLLRAPETPTTHTQYDTQRKASHLPLLSGCFMLFKREHYQELGGFDERFFLYFEDYDISLRSFLMNKSTIVNDLSVTHHWQRASHKKFRMFLIHLASGLKFYFKWGLTKKLPTKINQISVQRDSQY